MFTKVVNEKSRTLNTTETVNKINKKITIKQDLIICLVIFCFAIILMLPFMTSNTISGDDKSYHLSIINSLNDAFKNGIFFDKIVPLIGQDFGYDTGIFYSTIPASIAVIFMNIFNIKVNIAIGLEFIILFFLSGVVVYYFVKSINFKIVWYKRLVIALLYMASPYLLNNIYFRFAYSEVFLTLSTPMIFYGIYELVNKSNYKNFMILFTTGFSLSFLFHFTMSLYIALFVFIYLLFFVKDFLRSYKFLPFLISVFIVLTITATFYIPMIYNFNISSTADIVESSKSVYDHSFDFLTGRGIIIPIITAIIIILFSIYLYKNKTKNTKFSIAIFTLLVASFIMSTPLFPWLIVPKSLCFIQFPWRLYNIISLLDIICLYILFSQITTKKFTIPVLVSIIVICTTAFGMFTYSAYNGGILKDNLILVSTITNSENGISYNEGLGFNKHGDYLPSNTSEDYVFYRANNSNIILSSNVNVSEFANYQSKNMIRFLAESNENDKEVVLNIPYNFCENIKLSRFTTSSSHIQESVNIEMKTNIEYGDEKLTLILSPCNGESQIIISYEENSALDNYLKENPFEFIVTSGQASFSNFIKTKVNEYTVDITTNTETTIELPTLFYHGYKINYTTSESTYELQAINGENGFIEVSVNESGTLSIDFEAKYIDVANIISIIGICLFAIAIIIVLSVPRSFFTNIANKITQYLTTHKTIAEIIRFLIVGGIATIIDMLCMGITMYAMQKDIYSSFINVFINAPSPSTMATIVGTTVGFIAGLIINYILSILFVFNEKGDSKSTKGFLIFVLLSAIGLFINIIGTYIGYDLLHIHQWIVKILMILVVLVYNYISKKLILFRNKKVDKKSESNNEK